MLLHCKWYPEARKALREAAGDGWEDATYLLGGWIGRKVARTGTYVDGRNTRQLEARYEGDEGIHPFTLSDCGLSRSSDLRVG